MASTSTNLRQLCFILIGLSTVPSITFLYWSLRSPPTCGPLSATATRDLQTNLNLLLFPSAWNHLSFFPKVPPPRLLKIALFVKKWPHRNLVGGLERHALTLHLALAKRGHEVHVFTTSSSSANASAYLGANDNDNIHFHLTRPSPGNYLNQPLAWGQFQTQNSTGRPFDVVHTESVSLFHGRARNISTLVVSWHGIAYETIHSDIVSDLLRAPDEPRKLSLTERIPRVVEEVKFFQDYSHHVATSDHVGDVLKRIYMIPEERVHVILNGVDETMYKLDVERGREFLKKLGVPDDAGLVIGMAGRLVKDKGHPVTFEALKQVFNESESFRRGVFVLVAGDGPWGARYRRELGANVLVLGPLEQSQLARFYSSLDVFLNPTLRAQGLDHTFLEAMLSGVPVMGTRFASITGSVISGPEMGYTFLPTVGSVKEALHKIWREGRSVLREKGEVGRQRALQLFTATKMAACYERLFLCVSSRDGVGGREVDDYCRYPLPLLDYET